MTTAWTVPDSTFSTVVERVRNAIISSEKTGAHGGSHGHVDAM
jgi:hypothetical protein